MMVTGSKDDKDRMEAEVGLLIKACAQQIEQVRLWCGCLGVWLLRL